jgi:hypothetical protein
MKSCGTYSGYTIHIRDKTSPCTPCREESRIYQNSRRKRLNSELGYDPRRFKRHHITKQEYDTLLSKYDGKCWICFDSEAINIDHDHSCCSGSYSCGKCVRGILCNGCNTAIGLMKDQEHIISSALNYVKSFK